MENQYEQQAQAFLDKYGVSLRATLSDSKTPQWAEDGKCGHHYRVTLSRGGPLVCSASYKRIVFDFWGSIADAEKGQHPSAYDVLACISGDVNCPDAFKDFCADYGYDADSIRALQTFRRCSAFAKRLRAFFSPAELADLSQIQ